MNEKLIFYNKEQTDDSKYFNFIIPTYNGGYKLEVIVNCLLAQTSQNFHITVISDGPEPDTEKQLTKYFNIKNFTYCSTTRRYNDLGHTPRLLGLKQSKSKYSIMTGYDNYYVPIFVERFEKAVTKHDNVGLIFCDFILDHPRDGVKYNKFMDSKLEVNHIDFGCYAIDTQIANAVGIDVNEYAADWHLIASSLPIIKQQNKQIIKIQQTLYVHN